MSAANNKEIIAERKRRIFSIKTLIFLLISAGLIFFLLKIIDPERTITAFKNANIKFIICSIFVYGFSNLFKTLRFKIILHQYKVPLRRMFNIVSFHNFFNQILPARTGELTFIYYTGKQTDIPTVRATHALLVARILDLVIVSFIFTFSIMFVLDNSSYALVFSGITLAILSLLLLFNLKGIVLLSIKLITFMLDKSKISQKNRVVGIIEKLETISFELEDLNQKSNFFALVMSSILVWLTLYFFFYINILTFGVDITYLETLAGATGAVLSNVLPINSFGSFGTLEAGWTGGFVLIGMSGQDAITTAFGSHIITFVASAFFVIVSSSIVRIFHRK